MTDADLIELEAWACSHAAAGYRQADVVLRLLQRDRLRLQEVRDSDAATAEAERREREQKAFALRLAERIYAAHCVLARRAEKRQEEAAA